MTVKAIAINKLLPSDKNVRKTKSSKEADAELLASIRNHGLLQNLVVEASKKKDHYEVLAGERRRQQLLKLVEAKELKPTDTVQCNIVKESQEEISLAENTLRLQMHPADEFEAFQRLLSDKKHTEEEIADHFGCTVRHVQQRLRLAQVHPKIIKAYRDKKLTLEAVQAFTVETDKKSQLKAFESLLEQYTYEDQDENCIDAGDVRLELRQDTLTNKDKKAIFVTVDLYKAAGGKTTEDLFSNVIYIHDDELLSRLAIEKLSAIADKLKADGWNWVDASIDRDSSARNGMEQLRCKRDAALLEKLKKLEKQLSSLDEADKHGTPEYAALDSQIDELNQQIESTADYGKRKGEAGCIVHLNYRGKVEISYGWLRAAVVKADAKAKKEKEKKKTAAQKSDDTTDNTADEVRQEENEDQSLELSQNLLADLKKDRQIITQLHVAQDAVIARDILYWTLCHEIVGDDSLYGELINLITNAELPEEDEARHQSKAGIELEKIHAALDVSWFDEDPALSYERFCQLESNRKQMLMAYCVGKLISGGLSRPNEDRTAQDVMLDQLKIKWHHFWRPTEENFLGRVSKPTLAQVGSKFMGDGWPAIVEKSKKPELAARLAALFRGEDIGLPLKNADAAKHWIPDGFINK